MTTLTRIILAMTLLAASCKKHNDNPPAPPPVQTLSYGDSVFFLNPLGSEVKVAPQNVISGRYFGFPQGIDIDGNTGVINVSKSETGLRYQIYCVPDGSQDTISTMVTISGINFLDGFYKLSTSDSIVHPIYNGRASQSIPGLNNGSVFDEGANCNSQGCVVNVADGQINLAQTVRNGVFGTTPSNNDRHEFRLDYRINDKSGKAVNTLNVKLYYFDTMSDVTQEVYDIINSRQGTILSGIGQPPVIRGPAGITTMAERNVASGFNGAAAKPRPPCIFIIAR
ncbi:MAG TPA: hypothetical protein VL832_06825 [Puia sp.]|nr:hypothetical protein [Puia sp.]